MINSAQMTWKSFNSVTNVLQVNCFKAKSEFVIKFGESQMVFIASLCHESGAEFEFSFEQVNLHYIEGSICSWHSITWKPERVPPKKKWNLGVTRFFFYCYLLFPTNKSRRANDAKFNFLPFLIKIINCINGSKLHRYHSSRKLNGFFLIFWQLTAALSVEK